MLQDLRQLWNRGAPLEPRGHVFSFRAAAILFAAVFLLEMLAARSSLGAPFIWDDLHLIRTHTSAELVNAWSGTWDSDHIETPGFRPLTVYFNHFRALLFGTSVVAHRIFLAGLFSLYLVLAAMLARWLFGTGFWALLLGALLALFHTTSVYHELWIADGIHLLSGTLMLGAILFLLKSLSSGDALWLAGSLICTVLALLTREDSLAVYPLLVWCGAAFVWTSRDGRRALVPSKAALSAYALGILMVLGIYVYWRSAAVPEAAGVALNAEGFVWSLTRVVENAGDVANMIHPLPGYVFVIWGWIGWLAVLVILGILLLRRQQKRQVLFWAGAVVLSALPTLEVARANLLLLPATFWGLLLASVLAGLWRASAAPLSRVLAILMTIFAVAAPAYMSLAFRQEQRVSNLAIMCLNANLEFVTPATIPPATKDLVRDYLRPYGIVRKASLDTVYPALVRDAIAKGRIGANQKGLPFIPRFDFVPWFPGSPTACIDNLR